MARKTVPQLQKEAHEIARDHGWWEQRRELPELLCLIHSEVSEALQVYRDPTPRSPAELDAVLGEELADIVIRVLDLAGALQIDLEAAIVAKMEVNRKREYRHGGRKA